MATRFCPSPTGLLHLGNVRTALFNWLQAHRRGAPFLLRIEDTDRQRCRPEYEAAIGEDLAWLGLRADGETWRQSERGPIYDRHLGELRQRGLLYPCFCTDEELRVQRQTALAQGRPPRYGGHCRELAEAEVERRTAAGEPHALRFAVPGGRTLKVGDLIRGDSEVQTDLLGDFVVRRRDGEPTFLFCNALDDALAGVRWAIRGEDHRSNTPRQLLLLEALGLPAPIYGHLAVLKGRDGKPLSKRDGDTSVRALRQRGYLPAAMLNQVFRLGHKVSAGGVLDADAMVRQLDLEAVSHSPALWTLEGLQHWQKLAVQSAGTAELVDWLEPWLPALPEGAAAAELAEFLRPNLLLPDEAAPWPERLFGEDLPRSPEALRLLADAGAEFFRTALDCWRDCDGDWKRFVAELQGRSGLRGKQLFLPLRVALSGQSRGPELDAMAALMGSERVASRLARASTAA